MSSPAPSPGRPGARAARSGGATTVAPTVAAQARAVSSPSAATTSVGRQSANTTSSSGATAIGPCGTTTAPARRAPSTATQNAAPLPSRTTTRSPGAVPAADTRSASADTASSSWAHVSVFALVTSMTAGWSGTRAALAVTRSATCVPSTVLLGSPAALEAVRQSCTPLLAVTLGASFAVGSPDTRAWVTLTARIRPLT